MIIRYGCQSWGETAFTFDGRNICDPQGNILYTFDGTYIRKGASIYGEIVYSISGNCIYEGSTIKYSIHDDLIKEGGQSWGSTIFNITDKY